MRYFLAVAETCNVTVAARLLNMAQPPLSRQIKQIEEELQTRLFERKANRLYLTETGRLLQERVQEILSLTERSLQEVRTQEQNGKYTLSLGTVASAGTVLLPNLITAFNKSYPMVNFCLQIGETNRITELLEKNVIEVGVVRYPFDDDIFESYALPAEKLIVIFNSGFFTELKGLTSITVDELAKYQLLIHRRFEGKLQQIFEKHSCCPDFFCKSDDIMPLVAWSEAGLGLGVLPESVVSLTSLKGLSYLELNDEDMVTTSALVWVKKRQRSVMAEKFIEFFKEQIK